MYRWKYLAVGLIGLFFASGCASMSTLHTATPVEKGETEVSVTPGVFGATSSDGGGGYVPNAEVAVRYGLTENTDFGGKIFPIGAAFDLNHAFINSDSFAASVNPYASLVQISGGNGSASYGFLFGNILFDVAKSDKTTFTLGAKPGLFFASGSAGDTDADVSVSFGDQAFLIGGLAGVKLRASEDFAIMPSIDIVTSAEGGDGAIYQGSVSLMF